MTVEQLIKLLSNMNPQAIVYSRVGYESVQLVHYAWPTTAEDRKNIEGFRSDLEAVIIDS